MPIASAIHSDRRVWPPQRVTSHTENFLDVVERSREPPVRHTSGGVPINQNWIIPTAVAPTCRRSDGRNVHRCRLPSRSHASSKTVGLAHAITSADETTVDGHSPSPTPVVASSVDSPNLK
jgi:hypothetical protein